MKEVLENLSDENVKVIKFYYKNSRLVGNICTVCLLIGENSELLARGVSVCSLKDSHKKKIGKNLAMGRAIKALKGKQTTDPINFSSKENEIHIRNINITNNYINEINEEISRTHLGFKSFTQGKDIYYKVKIPLAYVLKETKKMFDYKSEYKPNITDEEKLIIGRRLLN